MAATLPSIIVTAETWIDVYRLVEIDAGAEIEIQNTGTTDLYFSIATDEPARDSTSYKIFKRAETITLDDGDVNVWLFSPQADGFINVSLFQSTIEGLLKTLIDVNRKILSQSYEQNKSILSQLKLLNARFEEMANTRINENDIGK